MDHETWTSKLADFFFSPANGGKPVFLFADDDALAEVADMEDPADACEDLAAAVRARLRLTHRNIFITLHEEHRRWRTTSPGERGVPPGLPLLALAVNAATHMRRDRDAGRRRTNYYEPFRDLIEDHRGEGMPPGYDLTLPRMWRDLETWLDGDLGGSCGVSTIRTRRDHRPHVGYAESQALFRESDERRLNWLFEDLELPPFSKWDADEPLLEKAQLRVEFKMWAPRARGLTEGARRLAQDDSFDELLEDILWDALCRWEGPATESGFPRARLHLGYAPFPVPMLRLWAQRRIGIPDVIELSDGRRLQSADLDWFDVTPLAVAPEILRDGIDLNSVDGGVEFSFEASSVIPMLENPTLGEWVSVHRVSPDVNHRVVVRKTLADRVRGFLRQYATDGWSEELRLPPELSGDWVIFRDVLISRMPGHLVDDRLWRLTPSEKMYLTFKGGLPLLSEGASVYLMGGAPDVWIPPAAARLSDGIISIDGQSHLGSTDGGVFPLEPLRLAAGEHEVQVGDTRRMLILINSRERIAHESAGSLGMAIAPGAQPALVRRRVAPVDEEDGFVVISGGLVRGEQVPVLPPVVKLRKRADLYYVLGAAPGEILSPNQPDDPPWLARARLDPGSFDVRVEFSPVWTVHIWTRGIVQVEAVATTPVERERRIGTSAQQQEWAAVLHDFADRFDGAQPNLARHYLLAARSILEEDQ